MILGVLGEACRGSVWESAGEEADLDRFEGVGGSMSISSAFRLATSGVSSFVTRSCVSACKFEPSRDVAADQARWDSGCA